MYRIMVLVFSLLINTSVQAERIKDLASVSGVRTNQLVGFGIVTGLDKSGDVSSLFVRQSLRNMAGNLGLTLPATINPKTKNTAVVSIHAELPPFAKPGQTIDVTVSSIGDAKSLRGGSLIMSPLRGPDGNVYAIAQGSLIVSGLSASGLDGSKVTVNSPLVGRIPNGATVERVVPTQFDQGRDLVFNLNNADFTTVTHMVEAINKSFGADTARAIDATSVSVRAPDNTDQRVSFVSMVENIEISPDDAPAKVVVNSRTGTVIINSMVRVQPAAVSHGSLTVTIKENLAVSQPGAFSRGRTEIVPNSDISVKEQNNHMFVFNPGVSLDEIVKAVNSVGAAPSDLVAILEALKSAGSLRAELIVI